MFVFSFRWEGRVAWRHVAVAITVAIAVLHAAGVSLPLRL